MAQDAPAQWIVATEEAKTLPAVEILTGRGFITGKSGSGKSNSASVIAEQLLENNYNLLIVDPEGEYYGLKEKYQLLHAGADDLCDIQVTVDHAETLAEISLERNLPVILDVSDFFDEEEAKQLIEETVKHLFKKEKEAQKPFLLMIEEMQEYLPQKGGSDDLSKLLERVAKRGRKRGLGVLGMSQRPSSVDKDFITQCDWMVWHKLTWKTDLDVVREILGSEKTDHIEDFEPGEAYLMTDWDDAVERVRFKQKSTHDAGATPGLESYDRPDLTSIGSELKREIRETTDVDFESIDTESTEQEPVDEDSAQPITAVDEESILPPDENAEPLFDGDGQVDNDELRAALERERRRSTRLRDEVSELRQILSEVEAEEIHVPYAGTKTEPSTDETEPILPAPSVQTEPPRPAKPTVPTPPAERSGVAGNLVEFGQMIVYLAKLVWHRLRLLVRRPRNSRSSERTN